MTNPKVKLLNGETFVRIGDEMTWPACSEKISNLSWRMRHFPDKVSKHDMMLAASVISGYLALVNSTQKTRDIVSKALVEANKQQRRNPIPSPRGSLQ